MKVSDIVNVRQLSAELTGKPLTIRKNFIPEEYKRSVMLLQLHIDQWRKEVARMGLTGPPKNDNPDLEPIPKMLACLEGQTECKVKADDLRGKFDRVELNIWSNGKCFMYNHWQDGELKIYYVYTIEEARNIRDNRP